jgi:Fe2+ transport system protein FeoA
LLRLIRLNKEKRKETMPLSSMEIGARRRIKGVTGNDAARKRLEALGFVEGMEGEIVNKVAGNLIVGVLGSRVAVCGKLAARIMV